jgi:predicted transcriptional regulator
VRLLAVVIALVARGAVAPPVTVADSTGRPRRFPDATKPMLVIYEDQDGGKDNRRAKEILGRVNASAENRAKVEAVAVADLEKWDWWPARKYALDDIRKTEAQKATTILLDWKGEIRKAWGLPKGKNSLILVAPDGKVLWSSQGTLSEAQIEELLALLRSLGLKT